MTDREKVKKFLKGKAVIQKEFIFNGHVYYIVAKKNKINYGNPFVTIKNGKPMFYSPLLTDKHFFEVAFGDS
jgi:hypothetical protein